MKIIAMYLPQFHTTPENNAWWGEGFTDWVSTRNAKPIFEGHFQPHEPLVANYYDLLKKETMQWQVDLMNKYGVDGLCFYHYWFKDGRKILEQPAENLLKWKEIEMPFCFCWANETWARSWSNIRNSNSWNSLKEDGQKSDSGILLKQSYGDKDAWKNHFDYLLPFFEDDRYIKIDNKPVFIIYMTRDIYCLSEMIDCFDELAKSAGIPGVYFICANTEQYIPSNVDATLIHEPQNSIKKSRKDNLKNGVKTVDYQFCWNNILASKSNYKKTYFEGFVSYDDTPRRGVRGTVVTNTSPERFRNNMKSLIDKSADLNNEFVFVNAWNEWGEGMYLEPDTKNEYAYLEAIKSAREAFEQNVSMRKKVEYEHIPGDRVDKFELYLNRLDYWMEAREKGISTKAYFDAFGIRKISIYGYGIFARHLISELRDTSIEVIQIIDKHPENVICGYETVTPDCMNKEIDALVVTSFYYMNDIETYFQNKDIKLVSFDSILNYMKTET